MSGPLLGYIVRGGDGNKTGVFGYSWPDNLIRGGELIVRRFAPTVDGRRRAQLMAIAVDGTVKRVVKRSGATIPCPPPDAGAVE